MSKKTEKPQAPEQLFHVIITKETPNPDYDPKASLTYHHPDDPKTRPYLTARVFDMTLTEKEFNAMRKAALEAM